MDNKFLVFTRASLRQRKKYFLYARLRLKFKFLRIILRLLSHIFKGKKFTALREKVFPLSTFNDFLHKHKLKKFYSFKFFRETLTIYSRKQMNFQFSCSMLIIITHTQSRRTILRLFTLHNGIIFHRHSLNKQLLYAHT